ncbi:hypothetical protein [Halomontanus rarus]|uniref:hypothetical protein n=1 Tax=Halomontanus rarus TaxID=3034020 RepID=UPI0023E806DA|nr:hypothetical protein [Halovivax sp. TS33]
MANWLRVGGMAVLAIIGLWIALEIVSIIFGIVSWIVSTVLTLAVLALLLYLVYIAFTKLRGGSGPRSRSRSRTGSSRSSSSSDSREKERIFE